MHTPPIEDWVPSTQWQTLGPDAVHIFSPDHVGFLILSQPIPPGFHLVRLEVQIRYRAHEDYDYAGLAVDHPPRKDALIGVSLRNRKVEARAVSLAAPCEVELDRPCHLALRLDDATAASDSPEYDIVFDGLVVGRWTRPVTRYGVFACEADVELTEIRVELAAD
jgi:hypothetical protein